MSYYPPQQRRRSSFSGLKLRLLIAGAIVLFSVVSYLSNSEINPITGQKQRVGNVTVEEEIAMGLNAAPQMAQQHNGHSRDVEASKIVRTMGAYLVEKLRVALNAEGKTIPYRFDFHLLADTRTVNAFALPGGQVFITEALYRKFTHDGQLAGVLGHEIGHVIERHGSERMAKGGLIKGIVSAGGVAGGDVGSARMASYVGNLVNMKYGRNDELESDRWAVVLMVLGGYNPYHMNDVMDILEASAGGGAPPEFMSTHPRPANRREHIDSIIKEKFPQGLEHLGLK